MPFSVELMRKRDSVDSALKEVLLSILDEVERSKHEDLKARSQIS